MTGGDSNKEACRRHYLRFRRTVKITRMSSGPNLQNISVPGHEYQPKGYPLLHTNTDHTEVEIWRRHMGSNVKLDLGVLYGIGVDHE